MPEPSEGPHITPEDYVAQDEIFKVGLQRGVSESATTLQPDMLACCIQDASGFGPVRWACVCKPMSEIKVSAALQARLAALKRQEDHISKEHERLEAEKLRHVK